MEQVQCDRTAAGAAIECRGRARGRAWWRTGRGPRQGGEAEERVLIWLDAEACALGAAHTGRSIAFYKGEQDERELLKLVSPFRQCLYRSLYKSV